MSKKNYGIPYMGSKNSIAEPLCKYMLWRHDKKYFIDACCGGLAISHYILENTRNIQVLANDLDTNLIEFYKTIGTPLFNELVEKYCLHWVDRDTYFKLMENSTGALKIILIAVWTFGNKNDGKGTYLFGTDIELQKELIHNLLVWGNEEHLTDYFKAHCSERERELTQIREWYKTLDENIKKMPFSKDKRLLFMNAWKKFSKKNGINRLEQQQQQADRLQNLERIETLERTTTTTTTMQQLQELERTTTTTTDINSNNKRIHFYNKDCIEFLNSLPKEILENAIVYLDPPYKGTAEYKEGEKDIHDRIVKWAIDHKDICPVYVSEYSLLDGLQNCFYESKIQTLCSTKETRTVKKERLLFNGYADTNECLGDLLGLWSE